MLSNKAIAATFNLLALVMELKEENPFKIRSYENAYRTLRKWEQPLGEMSRAELEAIAGVGKNIADKIEELLKTGQLQTLEKYKEDVPDGVIELLKVPGIGSKKAKIIWQTLGIESPGELLYACNENRLVEVKGFGAKTQQEFIERLQFYFAHQGMLRWPQANEIAQELSNYLLQTGTQTQIVGELARHCPVVHSIELLVTGNLPNTWPEDYTLVATTDTVCTLQTEGGLTIHLHVAQTQNAGTQWVELIGPADFVSALGPLPVADNEAALWQQLNRGPVPAPMRDLPDVLQMTIPQALVQVHDIKHVIHSHSTWSDGLHTLEEMAVAAKQAGFASLTITDHSKTAVYARGLSIDRVKEQWAEIERLNGILGPDFTILKGIESDILTDGSLDYPDDILSGFDLVIGSIHGNLRMDEATATARLLRAIENPHMHILGHPTGRLLLTRSGYPIDHKRIIDACAQHKVAIELNANPARLDLDYTWIPYALQQGVPIAINPDAHSREGIADIKYGVQTAQKGGLDAEHCVNAWDMSKLLAFLKK